MRIEARQVDMAAVPPDIAPRITPGQLFIGVGSTYEVLALALFEGRVNYQIVNDLGYPAWLPAWLFNVVKCELPSDWICNVFSDEPVVVLGPKFIAGDHDAYSSMVELDPNQVDRFWKRLESRELGGSDGRDT